jgi:hypothetical protein
MPRPMKVRPRNAGTSTALGRKRPSMCSAPTKAMKAASTFAAFATLTAPVTRNSGKSTKPAAKEPKIEPKVFAP